MDLGAAPGNQFRAILLAIILLLMVVSCRLPALHPATTSAVVVSVLDGDTIQVAIDAEIERLRILGIDAPEAGACGSGEATARLTELIADQEVEVVDDSRSDSRDRYGRILAYIDLDGTDVGQLLISEGLAGAWWPSSSPTPDRGPDYLTAGRLAQRGAAGSWANCETVGRPMASA